MLIYFTQLFKCSCFILVFLLSINNSNAQQFHYEKDYPILLKRAKNEKDSLYYFRLLTKFTKNDSSLTISETLSLMIGFSGLPAYQPFTDVKTERLLVKLNDSGSYETVLKVCDTFLQRHPLNQAGIIEKAYAFFKLKQNDSATFYKEQFARIMATMDWSNDGRTADNAMFALGPDDGKNFADKYYHADVGETSTVTDGHGNYCSKVEMKFKKDGKLQRLYFYFVLQHAANTTVKKH